MNVPVRHDWPLLIIELNMAGWTNYRIAKICCNSDQHQVARWKSGTIPNHYEGQLLLALHAGIINLAEAEAPAGNADRMHAESSSAHG